MMDTSRGKMVWQVRSVYGMRVKVVAEDHPIDFEVRGAFMNLSAQDLIVISTALVAAIGNAYLFVVAIHDGHRGLYRVAAVASFVFMLVAAVFFLRAL